VEEGTQRTPERGYRCEPDSLKQYFDPAHL
jgi:hypothetical protein